MRNLSLASLVVLSLDLAAAQAEYRLTILHTNDFHSRFGPLDRFDNSCADAQNAAGRCFGGSARLATAIAEARTRAENVVLLDAGDQFPSGGDPASARPELLAKLMNRMGYDAIALGSHEFDAGPEIAHGFIDALDFPALMANADLSAAPALAGRIHGSTVIERAGERLGVIGVAPASESAWSHVGDIELADPVLAVQAQVDMLTADGVGKIIVLSHAGFGADQRIARETKGVDVIVGGHTHTYLSNVLEPSQGPYPTVENGVPIVHAWPFGNTLGKLEVTFDDSGRLLGAEGDQIRLDAGVAEDEDISALIAEALAQGR